MTAGRTARVGAGEEHMARIKKKISVCDIVSSRPGEGVHT